MSNEALIHSAAITLGQNRGRPRIYLQGRYLLDAGFEPGRRVSATFSKNQVTFDLSDEGERKVSSKKNKTVPVIDVNSLALAEAFGHTTALIVKVRNNSITITATRTEAKKATRCRNGKEGSLFSGGGLLSQAAKQAGFAPAWACELEEVYADIFRANHKGAVVHNCSVAELDTADLEPVELLTAGIPCQPFSSKRQKNGQVPEAHDLGDMTFWTLRIIDALNPATVIIEQVPHFIDSGAGHILMRSLERLGYSVESKIIDPAKMGHLAGRLRCVIVATSDGDKVAWPTEVESDKTLGPSLEDVAPDSDEWFTSDTKAWLFNHWDKQTAKGNGFASAQLDAATTRVPAITKRYFNGQGDGAVIKHPSKVGAFRWFRLTEVARLMGLPEDYTLPKAKTRAGEILGQAVHVGAFAQVIEGIG